MGDVDMHSRLFTGKEEESERTFTDDCWRHRVIVG
jgi:hypothetical protein